MRRQEILAIGGDSIEVNLNLVVPRPRWVFRSGRKDQSSIIGEKLEVHLHLVEVHHALFDLQVPRELQWTRLVGVNVAASSVHGPDTVHGTAQGPGPALFLGHDALHAPEARVQHEDRLAPVLFDVDERREVERLPVTLQFGPADVGEDHFFHAPRHFVHVRQGPGLALGGGHHDLDLQPRTQVEEFLYGAIRSRGAWLRDRVVPDGVVVAEVPNHGQPVHPVQQEGIRGRPVLEAE